MGCYKIDKLDKIVIAFTFIIVTFVCLFNTFCFASEEVDKIILNGFVVNTNQGVNQFFSGNDGVGFYFETIKGHTYKIKNNIGDSISILYCTDIPYNGYTTTEPRKYLFPGDSFEYTANNENIICVYIGKNSLVTDFEQRVEVIDITPVGLEAVIGNLTLNVGLTHIWNIFEKTIPWVLVVVAFSLGVWFIKHNIIEHSKGREY